MEGTVLRQRLLMYVGVLGVVLATVVSAQPVLGANVVVQEAHYSLPSDAHGNAKFGTDVAIDGDVAVVGAPAIDPGSPIEGAYVVTHDASGWGNPQALAITLAAGSDPNYAGASVDISGDTIVVGAPSEDVPDPLHADNRFRSGAVYVFVKNGTSWVQQARLTAPEPSDLQEFGASVAIDGDTLVVGASGAGALPGAGAAYVFTRSVGAWTSSPVLLQASNADPGDFFGSAVAIDGDTIAVGAWAEQSAL